MSYQLSTNSQQLYFFAFIVAIVGNMKYIDIEFSNQPVVLPLPPNVEVTDTMDDLINIKDVKREQEVVSTSAFKGFLVPPCNIRNPNAEEDATSRASDTNILKRYRLTDLNRAATFRRSVAATNLYIPMSTFDFNTSASSFRDDEPDYVYLQHRRYVKYHILRVFLLSF